MSLRANFLKVLLVSGLVLLCPRAVLANDLSISNIVLEDRDPSAGTVVVKFDLSWKNSWKTKINHDAVWLTIRLQDSTANPSAKQLCDLKTSGLTPLDTDIGSNSSLEIYIPEDKKGAFVRPSVFGANATVSTTELELKVNYESCGFSSTDNVYVSVFGLEMVFIPEGEFYAGDYSSSSASFVEGSSDTDPWYISDSSAIGVSNPSSDGYRYVSANNANEDSTGSSFTISSDFPKGYQSFYVMKYEITEGQWTEFVNSLPSAEARAAHDLTDSSHKNSDSVIARNTISCSGSPLFCTTDRPYRAVGYLSWMNLSAFLDWAALRPFTELEFEKMSRGPLLPVESEYAWGTTDITAASTLSGTDEDGTETVSTTNANARYNNISLTGGDSGNGSEYASGPLRIGIFADSSATRITSGAGYYGVMELSGNLSEQVVTIGNTSGRLFEGTHGDGALTQTSGYAGHADEVDWPGMDGVTERGVTGASGAGLRGGGYSDSASRLQVSDRQVAASGVETGNANVGGRGARTYDAE